MRIVAVGGGTGLPVVLTALRRHLPASARITAIVTAADDGGSSGVLRKLGPILCQLVTRERADGPPARLTVGV